MKQLLTAFLVVIFLCVSFFNASAGKKTTSQYGTHYVSGKGYWVVKDAGTTTQKVTVLYFNNQNELIRKETRLKRNADLNRKKVLRSLKRSLEEAIEWSQPI